MKKLVLFTVLLSFSFMGQAADENCIDCETRHLTGGQVQFTGTNTGDLNAVTTNVRRTIASEKVDADLIEEVCEAMEALDFAGILEIMAEEELKFEDVYSQFQCGKSIPQLMDYVVDLPMKYGNTISKMLVYFDGVKVKDPTFKYDSIINIPFTFVDSDGKKYVTTLLDRIITTLPKLPQESKDRLERVKASLKDRGALTAAQLNIGGN